MGSTVRRTRTQTQTLGRGTADAQAVKQQQHDGNTPSKLQRLLPGVGPFFTKLPLVDGFLVQDGKRHISARRFVPPSFNDIRLILNSAQLISLVDSRLQLVTFDGDATLYEDGLNLEAESPLIPRILGQLSRHTRPCLSPVAPGG